MRTMKIMWMMLIVQFAGARAMAQHAYVPFVEEGKQWLCRNVELYSGKNYSYTIHGDTLLQDIPFKKLYISSTVRYEDDTPRYYAALREEDEKVYIVYQDEESPMLLFDFGVSEGDEVEMGHMKMTVEDIMSGADTRGVAHKKIFCEIISNTAIDLHRPEYYAYVSGIGGFADYAPIDPFDLTCTDRYYDKSVGFRGNISKIYVGESCVFDYGRDWPVILDVQPTPLTISDATTATDAAPAASPLYDLSGRRISGMPTRGVYIRGGRKYVSKVGEIPST